MNSSKEARACPHQRNVFVGWIESCFHCQNSKFCAKQNCEKLYLSDCSRKTRFPVLSMLQKTLVSSTLFMSRKNRIPMALRFISQSVELLRSLITIWMEWWICTLHREGVTHPLTGALKPISSTVIWGACFLNPHCRLLLKISDIQSV